MPKQEKPERLDRHSSTGNRGLPKKEGYAGKYAWGKAGTGEDGEKIIDNKDPNYVSEEDEEDVVFEKIEIPLPYETMVKEFLISGDFDEACSSLIELNSPNTQDQFIKKALIVAMEKQAFERELISTLFSIMYSRIISPAKISEGFQHALDSLEDSVLDTPNAAEILSKFLARAIVDEIVPPIFLQTAVASNKNAEDALCLATGLINEKHGSERLANVWGPGDMRSVKRLKEEVLLIIEEYLTNVDKNEAEQNLRKLNCPSFHFQFIKQAIRIALVKPQEQKKIAELLNHFFQIALVSKVHIARGFNICFETIDDIKLDVPQAEKFLSDFVQLCDSMGFLPKENMKQLKQ